MIPRFSRPEMAAIWTLENKYRIWLDIQLLAAEAQAEIGTIPKDAPAKIRKKAAFDGARIEELEKELKHDVIAFLTNVGENVGEEARYLHLGMTSSDMIDTGFALLLRQAADMIIADIDGLLDALKTRALEHKMTFCIGRSHGIHAEPTTFGLKLAGHYAAFRRAKDRMIAARAEISTCALSGAVGTFATINPAVEKYVADKLNLTPETISTQIIPRDRHAMFFATLAVVASSIENLAVEIRHLQRTEVREVEESFSKGQKGSSAMPHKRNPILTENLTGLARLIRAAVTPALENVALWHERDISHSAVERVIAPDATILTDFALSRLTDVVKGLAVYPERMKKNLQATGGLVFSQAVMLALTESGMKREDAYKIVQSHAMKVWDEGADFKTLLLADKNVTLSAALLDQIFDDARYAENVGGIVDRALAG